jgi:hypothetical protein
MPHQCISNQHLANSQSTTPIHVACKFLLDCLVLKILLQVLLGSKFAEDLLVHGLSIGAPYNALKCLFLYFVFELFDYDFVVNFRQFQVDFGGSEFVAKNHNRIARNGVKSHL